jgi:hypothetical protein
MNYVKFLVALAAICVLIIPAFSMPDYGVGKDANQMWQGQDGKQISQGQDNTQKTCGCQNSMMGQANTQNTCGCEKSVTGQDGKQLPPMIGQDGKQMPHGQDNAQKAFGCQKSMMGSQDGNKMDHKNVKSMMGGREKGGNGGVKLVIVNLHV